MTDPTPETTPTRDEAVLSVDALAQEIRRVDGSHSLGAGALAEALMPFILASAPAPASGMDAVLNLYREAVRIDVKMEGPQFMGANSSALKRAWEADRASLSPAATPVSEAEPVAWRWRAKDRPNDDWSTTTKEPAPADFLSCEIEPLYAVARSAQ